MHASVLARQSPHRRICAMRLRQICQRLRCGSEIPSQGFSGMPHTKFTRHIPYRIDHVVAGSRQTWLWVVFLGGVGVYKEPPGAWCSTGGPCDGECGGVLLSHILSGAVPSPCQALASGFGMGSGRLTWAMAAANLQFFFPPSRGRGMVPGGGPGTGGWTRCFVVPRFVTMRSLSPGMPHAAVGAW